jgi:2-methylisocitrate lyase-like PEP mutase family enzyme
MSPSQRLRERLAQPGIVRSVAPHDAFTARVMADAGLELLFLGGFGASASALGLPDLGFITLPEMARIARSITAVVDAPLIVDADTGHGDLPQVRRTVQELERAGAAGLLLEDQVSPKRCGHFAGKGVIPCEEMLIKLRVALDARRDANFVIVARTDARAVEGLNAAIDRACRYAEVGADVGFVEAPQSVDELARIAREVPNPQLANMLLGGVTPIVSASELERLGFKLCVSPVESLAVTAFAVQQLARAMLMEGRVDGLSSQMVPFVDLQRLLGVDEHLALRTRSADESN